MKILISADMEGATGVTWPADCEPGTEQWQRCRRMFTSDVNAAVAGFSDAGAEPVLINEAHATMPNLARRFEPAPAAEFRAEVEADAAQLAQAAAIVPGVQQLGDRLVGYQSSSAYELIRTFKVVCTMISAAVEKDYG